MIIWEEMEKILRQDPEYARISDLLRPYYHFMWHVLACREISLKDRSKIVKYIEKLADKASKK